MPEPLSPARRRPAPEADGEAGMALLTVLWFVALMSALAVSLVDLGRDTAYATRNAVLAIESRASMAGAVAIAAESLRLDRYPASGVLDWREGHRAVSVEAVPEGGKIDLNAAADELIEALAKVAATDPAAGLALGHAILDWRDPGSERRLAGAEADDYAAAGRRARPRDGPFHFPAELRAVLGVDAATYARLAPNVTVFNGADRPPAASLAPLAEAALLGLAEGDAAGLATENPFDPDAQALEDAEDDSATPMFVADPNGLYTLDIELAYDDGPRFRQQIVIWIDPPPELGRYAVLQSQSVVLPAVHRSPAATEESAWPGP